jgi:hypothetical protein
MITDERVFCAAGQLDAALQGWDIDAQHIEICRDAKGEPWLLGEGSYGKVRRASVCVNGGTASPWHVCSSASPAALPLVT